MENVLILKINFELSKASNKERNEFRTEVYRFDGAKCAYDERKEKKEDAKIHLMKKVLHEAKEHR